MVPSPKSKKVLNEHSRGTYLEKSQSSERSEASPDTYDLSPSISSLARSVAEIPEQ